MAKVSIQFDLDLVEANMLQDLLKWRARETKEDVQTTMAWAIKLSHTLLRARRLGRLIQVFHGDGRIEDISV